MMRRSKIGYSDFYDLMKKGRLARDYALIHYDELAKRPAAHILYGPSSNYLGGMVPVRSKSPKPHLLSTHTRKKSYTAYELDENDKVIRVTHVRKSVPDCTYHLFEIDGITYGQPFFPDQNKPYPQATMAIQYDNGHPAYHAMTKGDHYLYAEFYDYPDPNTVHADLYLFIPEGTVAPGVPKNFEAPFGAWDSPVTLDSYEQPYQPFAVKSP